MTYTRMLSTIERYYVSCDTQHHTPCVNQMVVEGKGYIDEKQLRSAVTKASYANPGSRVKLVGHLGFSRWVDSEHSTPLRIVHSDWNGCTNENAEFLLHPLPTRTGPTSEVVLVINKETYFIIFRTHHGAMDGRGTLHFAQDVFRCLRGEQPIGENSRINDMQLAKSVNNHSTATALGPDISAATGEAITDTSNETSPSHSLWLRHTLTGKHKNLLAKVALEIAAYARTNHTDPVRFQIPVDMRPHKKDLYSTANLTGGIVVNVDENSSEADWNSDIKQQLSDKKETEIPSFFKIFPFHLLNWVPTRLIRKSNNNLIKKRRDNSVFRTTGIISNLGLLKIDQFMFDGFLANTSYFIPPEFETTALFVTLTGNLNGVEIIMRSPSQLDGGRVEKLMNFVINNIEQSASQANA